MFGRQRFLATAALLGVVVGGAITGVSSSAIVTKLLVELHRLANPETRLILGIIVLEDLFLALYLAALAPVLGKADSVADGALLFARALVFLLVLAAVARWGGPLVGKVVSAKSDELLVVLFVGSASQKTLPWQMFTGLREQISPTILAVAAVLELIKADLAHANMIKDARTAPDTCTKCHKGNEAAELLKSYKK